MSGLSNPDNPDWLTLQIVGIANYALKYETSRDVLQHLANEFRRASEALETEIKLRALTGDHAGSGSFG